MVWKTINLKRRNNIKYRKKIRLNIVMDVHCLIGKKHREMCYTTYSRNDFLLPLLGELSEHILHLAALLRIIYTSNILPSKAYIQLLMETNVERPRPFKPVQDKLKLAYSLCLIIILFP